MNIKNQSHTPYSILISPGGLAADGYLFTGWIGTHLLNSCSIEMFRYFSRTLKKGLTRLGNYWFGPEALQMVTAGVKFIPAGGRKNLAEGTFNE